MAEVNDASETASLTVAVAVDSGSTLAVAGFSSTSDSASRHRLLKLLILNGQFYVCGKIVRVPLTSLVR